jgi:hypothetical protein
MVEVSARVWSRWRELGEKSSKPTINLRLSSSLAPLAALAVVDDIAGDAFATLLAELEAANQQRSEFYRAVLRTAAVPGGVLFRIGEGIEDFERLLELILSGLDRRGLDGSLELFESLDVKRLPISVPLLECRLRVTGERYHFKGTHYRWRVDPDSWTRVIAAALQWCVAEARVGASLGVDLMPRAAVGPEDDLEALLLSAIERSPFGIVDCASGGVDRWRMVAVEPFKGSRVAR